MYSAKSCRLLSYNYIILMNLKYRIIRNSDIATELRAGRSGDRIPAGTRFSAPVQTDHGAHTASCKMGTETFPGVKSGRGVTLTPHPLLVSWSIKSRAIPLLLL